MQANKTSKSKKTKINGKSKETKPTSWFTRVVMSKQFTYIALPISLIACTISVFALLSKLTYKEQITVFEFTAYSTQYIDDNTMELGITTVEQSGVHGKRNVYYETTNSLLTKEELSRDYLRFEDTQAATDEIIRRGTRKWQYMYCSDGSYNYYTDEQFKNPLTGFTHQSPDACSESGHGAMTQLADVPPRATYTPAQTTPVTPTTPYIPPVFYYEDFSSDYSSMFENAGNSGYDDFSSNNSDSSVNEEQEKLEQEKRRLTAKNTCQDRASTTYRSLISQLGAMGVSGSSSTSNAESVARNQYYECMTSYGF